MASEIRRSDVARVFRAYAEAPAAIPDEIVRAALGTAGVVASPQAAARMREYLQNVFFRAASGLEAIE